MNFDLFRVSRDLRRVKLDPLHISPDPMSLKRDAPFFNDEPEQVEFDQDLHQA